MRVHLRIIRAVKTIQTLQITPLPDLWHRETRTVFFTVMMREGEQSTISSVRVLGLGDGLVQKLVTLPELQPSSVFSSCRIREAVNSLWPSGTTSSNLSFAIQAVREREIRKVNVVIDFSPVRSVGDGLHELTNPLARIGSLSRPGSRMSRFYDSLAI